MSQVSTALISHGRRGVATVPGARPASSRNRKVINRAWRGLQLNTTETKDRLGMDGLKSYEDGGRDAANQPSSILGLVGGCYNCFSLDKENFARGTVRGKTHAYPAASVARPFTYLQRVFLPLTFLTSLWFTQRQRSTFKISEHSEKRKS